MRRNLLALIVAVCLPVLTFAQSADDDMYFVPKKKTETKDKKGTLVKTPVHEVKVEDGASAVGDTSDYHTGQLRDVDEYNRRGSQQVRTRLVGDTLYVVTDDGEETVYAAGDDTPVESGSQMSEYYYDDDYDDFHYATRLRRYHGVYLYDPFYADFAYGWHDPWYYSWYDPWRYSWSWHGHWHNPWYGWYGGFSWGGHHHRHGSFGYAGRPYRSISHPVMRGGRTGRTAVSPSGRGTPRGTRIGGNFGRSGRSLINTNRSSGRVSKDSGYSAPSRGASSSPRGSSVSTPRGGSSVGSGSMGGGSRGSFGGSRGGGSGRSGGVRGR